MKKRRSAVTPFVTVLVIVLILLAAMVVIIKPEKFNVAGKVTALFRGRVEYHLDEMPADELTLKSASVKDLKIGNTLVLVNKDHPLDQYYKPSICEYKDSGVMMSTASVDSYAALSKAIMDNCGEPLYVMSSYRTPEEQQELYENQGSNEAMPAHCSEHETGLAQDLYFSGFAGSSINKCPAGKYLTEHAPEYGFIVRYPSYGRIVTGIDYEPWHFRYVGQPHSKIITANGLTFEEYIDGLEYGSFYAYEDYIITRQKGDTLLLPENCTCDISIDNCGGYIITAKKQ
ncbi:M15 family metallopeptidase [Ruminococcus albus]|uniref:D-alanyl-D-alanine carboxypeptidase n=1 Tax=Ruminococcus albus TaxID=1264 RepID=A0A1H7IQR9_RUMAL|nr:M15 family metallopeptidase [Ruminococcus albus]SEK64799.1 D-alanyl-D-alanine carboxypeptidase [Ruminococcus albus]